VKDYRQIGTSMTASSETMVKWCKQSWVFHVTITSSTFALLLTRLLC